VCLGCSTSSVISPMSDVYKGEFKDNQFEGFGEMLYANGSHYQGMHSKGVRHGRGVWFNASTAWTVYGSFVDDQEDGEMVVKSPIPSSILNVSPRSGGDTLAYEIRIGVWEKGVFKRWKNKLSNPVATRSFVALFAPPKPKTMEEPRNSFTRT